MAKSTKIYAIFITLAVLLAGCADQSDPGLQQVTLYDVVELAANGDSGSQFTLYHGDTPIALTSTSRISDKVEVGQSLLIAYIPESGEAYTPGPINLRGAYAITNSQLVVEDASEIAGWDGDPVYLMSIWRAGAKINVRCKLPVSESTRRLALVADEATMGAAVPQLYLAHDLPDDTPTFDGQYYISFDISELAENPNYTGVDVHVNNSNLTTSLFHIEL